MNQNIIEYARELSVNKLFDTNGFSTVWNTWKNKINSDIFKSSAPTEYQIYSIGDNLRDIFKAQDKLEEAKAMLLEVEQIGKR